MKTRSPSIAKLVPWLVGLVVSAISSARAETWVVDWAVVPEKSPVFCIELQTVPYTLEVTGTYLVGRIRNRAAFSTEIAADGAVSHKFTSPGTARLEITGNARTRELRLRNLSSNCVWQMVPQ